MSVTNLDSETAEEIAEEQNVDIEPALERLEDVESRAEGDISAEDAEDFVESYCTFVGGFQVASEEALARLESNLSEDYELGAGDFDEMTVDEFRNNQLALDDSVDYDIWGTLRGEVVYINPDPHKSMDEQFILDDGSAGVNNGIQVTNFGGEGVDELDVEKGDTVELRGVVANEWETRDGTTNVDAKVTNKTELEHIDAEFDLGPEQVTVSGEIIGMNQAGQNDVVIERPLDEEDVCEERDLRVQATLKLGEGQTVTVNLRNEAAEEAAGMDLEEAIEIATEQMDTAAVTTIARSNLMGENIEVTGSYWPDNNMIDVEDPEDLELGVDTASAANAAISAA